MTWANVFASETDIVMLQEIENPDCIVHTILMEDECWQNQVKHQEHVWRTTVAAQREDVQKRWFKPHIAGVISARRESLIVMSMYALWQKPNAATESSWIYADTSTNRLTSDLSAYIGTVRGHRIIAAGDLNIYHGYDDAPTGLCIRVEVDRVLLHLLALNGVAECGPIDHARVVVEGGGVKVVCFETSRRKLAFND